MMDNDDLLAAFVVLAIVVALYWCDCDLQGVWLGVWLAP